MTQSTSRTCLRDACRYGACVLTLGAGLLSSCIGAATLLEQAGAEMVHAGSAVDAVPALLPAPARDTVPHLRNRLPAPALKRAP